MASGTAEHEAALDLVDESCGLGFHPKTLAADKNYDTRHCVGELRQRGVTPHAAQNNSGRRSAIERRTTRHAGYGVSQHFRKRVEEIIGWMKTTGGFRRTRFRALARTQLAGWLVAAAYNLVRIARLAAAELAS